MGSGPKPSIVPTPEYLAVRNAEVKKRADEAAALTEATRVSLLPRPMSASAAQYKQDRGGNYGQPFRRRTLLTSPLSQLGSPGGAQQGQGFALKRLLGE